MNDPLRPQHISALFALMGTARETSNTELHERAGFRIDGKLRRELNQLNLVTSSRQGGKPFVHELTDRGWKRCAAELANPLGAGHLAGAFHLVLDGIGRFLERENTVLAHVFQPEAEVVDLPVDAQITAVYRQLAEKQGDWVRLAELRPHLNGTPRSEVDRVLKEMSRASQAHLAPDPDRKSLTAADREAAVRVGGEDNHLLIVERS